MTYTVSTTSNGKHIGTGVLFTNLDETTLKTFQAHSTHLSNFATMMDKPVGALQHDLQDLWYLIYVQLERLGYPTDLNATYEVAGYNLALEYWLCSIAVEQKSALESAFSDAIIRMKKIAQALTNGRDNTAIRLYSSLVKSMMRVQATLMEDRYIAGRERTGEGAEVAKKSKQDRQTKAIALAKELLTKNKHWKKVDTYIPIGKELGVSPHTVKRYLNDIKFMP